MAEPRQRQRPFRRNRWGHGPTIGMINGSGLQTPVVRSVPGLTQLLRHGTGCCAMTAS